MAEPTGAVRALSRWLGGTIVCAALATAIARPALADPVAPFVDPPFANLCVVRHFGEGEAPPIEGFADEPLCVEYQKRDITVANGGAVRFLAAEPARFAIAVPKCRYWQQDHWSVQVAPGDLALVRWDGSYWFDKGGGTGGARLRNFTIAGAPAGPDQAADLIAPLDPEMAAVIRTYGEGPSGGGGSSFCLGFQDPTCVPAPCESADPCACDVAAARAAAAGACDCAAATDHGAYVACVSHSANAEVTAGRLAPRCRGQVVRCASRSTCGKPGFSTCCRTNARGVTKCHIKRDGRCRAPARGGACTGTKTSCCDACTPSGCAAPDPGSCF